MVTWEPTRRLLTGSERTGLKVLLGLVGGGVLLVGLGIGYFYFGYYRPLTEARAAMNQFATEIREHREPVSVACPAVFETALLTHAMYDPEVQSCHPIGYAFHELSPVVGSSLNPRLELQCATGKDVEVQTVSISLFGIDGGPCGPKNLGFVPARVVITRLDGSERVVFRLPSTAHETLFGH